MNIIGCWVVTNLSWVIGLEEIHRNGYLLLIIFITVSFFLGSTTELSVFTILRFHNHDVSIGVCLEFRRSEERCSIRFTRNSLNPRLDGRTWSERNSLRAVHIEASFDLIICTLL